MLICTFPAYLSTVIIFYPEGCLLLCNRIPKGNMKPELIPTQTVYPPEGPKPKVCVTTTNKNMEEKSDRVGSLLIPHRKNSAKRNNRLSSDLIRKK